VIAIFGRILRIVSLALLFGGSVGVVFSAIVLVKAAKEAGVPVAEAAAANAPIFIHFSKVAFAAAIGLLLGESLDYAFRKKWNKLTLAQYCSSLLCVALVMIFNFGLVPPMERLLPVIKTDEAARVTFQDLHHGSRMVFGGTIIMALLSLILPAFGALKSTDNTTDSV
jgi:hypothetical protein